MRRKENLRSKIFNIKKDILIGILLLAVSLSASCAAPTESDDVKDIKAWDFFRRNAKALEEREREADEQQEEDEKEESIYSDMHLKLSVAGEGYDVFTPGSEGGLSYRYGPSLLLEDDGSINAYFAAPGDSSDEYDWITYKHSDDGGATWSQEKVVLSPTPLSRDELSVCDPDVFFYDGYYYIGYTSTLDSTKQGIVNSVYLARSRYPDGPFLKWDGEGWGGDPVPIIYYDGTWNGWGAGEASFVIRDDKLFVYSTRDGYDANNERIKSTEVHTADIRNEDWPKDLEFAGYAVIRSDTDTESEEYTDYVLEDSDSWDVAYVEQYEKFVALTTNRRFDNNSCLLYYESNDGIYFERVSELNTNVICGCHNCGIMSDGSGHIKPYDPVRIGYAYNGKGNSEWGKWATRIAPATIEITEEIDRSEEEASNLMLPITYKKWERGADPFFIVTDSNVKSMKEDGDGPYAAYAWIDNYRVSHIINASDVIFSGYDKDIVEIHNGVISPVSAGMTSVTIGYGGVSRQIRLRVFSGENSISSDATDKGITEFISPVDEYNVSMSRPYAVAVRPLIKRRDYSIVEMSLDGIVANGVTFESLDESICTVRADGIITPLSPGNTQIRVTCRDDMSYMVKVSVVE